jgi:hypothetical protein
MYVAHEKVMRSVHAMKVFVAPRLLNRGNSWRRLVLFTPQPPLPPKKEKPVPTVIISQFK